MKPVKGFKSTRKKPHIRRVRTLDTAASLRPASSRIDPERYAQLREWLDLPAEGVIYYQYTPKTRAEEINFTLDRVGTVWYTPERYISTDNKVRQVRCTRSQWRRGAL